VDIDDIKERQEEYGLVFSENTSERVDPLQSGIKQ